MILLRVLKGEPESRVFLVNRQKVQKADYSNITERGYLRKCFRTSSGIRQGFHIVPFPFNFVTDDVLG